MLNVARMRDSLNLEFSRIGRVLSSPKRIEIIELLRQCPKSVETLADNTGMSLANTSQHLQVLRGAGMVEAQRQGTYMIYQLTSPLVHELVSMVRQVAETHLADVDRAIAKIREGAAELENVDRMKLVQLAKEGKVIVLDVRPSDEYEAGHLPYAVSIPLAKLEKELSSLPHEQQIVAYCRGPYCLLAGEAVRILRKKGFQASNIRDGVGEWKALGLPVETGAPEEQDMKQTR
ncbi:MAG: metalloregulator ArsR/SmtB family transcription factor [Calditrichaeota bacterium]|nr:metalloregulator ArsR/SmtB family transcription factor [Calditrichota bacterium]MCB9367092.1 metalloregulator ArsR/SmtB family transcription factor [Calditrichota bacterium]